MSTFFWPKVPKKKLNGVGLITSILYKCHTYHIRELAQKKLNGVGPITSILYKCLHRILVSIYENHKKIINVLKVHMRNTHICACNWPISDSSSL